MKYKKTIKIFVWIFAILVLLAVSPIISLGVSMWYDDHTYYILEDCTSDQSKEILQMIGLDNGRDVNVAYIEYKLTDGTHRLRSFNIILQIDNNDTIKEIDNDIKKRSFYNNYDTESIAVKSIQNGILNIIYSYNVKNNNGELEKYIKKNGRRKIRVFD